MGIFGCWDKIVAIFAMDNHRQYVSQAGENSIKVGSILDEDVEKSAGFRTQDRPMSFSG